MLTILRFIGDGIALFGQLVAWGLVTVLNTLISALGALIGVLLALLPSLPGAPNLSGNGVLQMIGWLLPLGEWAAFLTVLITAYVAFLVVRVALNWVKAL